MENEATLTPIEGLIMTKVSKSVIPHTAQFASTMSELDQMQFIERSRQLTTIGGGVNVELVVKSIKLDVNDMQMCEIVQRTLGKPKILQPEITSCVWNDETLKPWIQTSSKSNRHPARIRKRRRSQRPIKTVASV